MVAVAVVIGPPCMMCWFPDACGQILYMNTPTTSHNNDAAELKLGDPADSPPDWEAIAHVVECPLCEYNLYGLTQPRCPECGYRFAWKEILDPRRANHEYLFEHHSGRSWWSWWKTLVGGLRPQTFWKELHPSQKARPWRLFVYAFLTVLIASAPGWLEM